MLGTFFERALECAGPLGWTPGHPLIQPLHRKKGLPRRAGSQHTQVAGAAVCPWGSSQLTKGEEECARRRVGMGSGDTSNEAGKKRIGS